VFPTLNVLDQAMLFVLRQRFLRLLVERELGERIEVFLLRLIRDDVMDAPRESGDVERVQ